eukprot:CAMPEP_0202908980 /NCGR_PEP_ID=MMETSP1392-20130828/47857_1 /ASSEMBLY_ACC=CAM_ASM_000868 /TAXON_ID=225041 /ORGANISM="Chlamydomonas chlamydogama, Strain SAG 11-48b" /LENGTH=59 /DNA_ID=CAMNT_0049598545 /DNA_START=103 /DNA_END=279 /DNA_ORIENTATION=-
MTSLQSLGFNRSTGEEDNAPLTDVELSVHSPQVPGPQLTQQTRAVQLESQGANGVGDVN